MTKMPLSPNKKIKIRASDRESSASMEATKERAGLLDKILPPALADAGLEDCALPPESIQEAFRKAANAVKSRAASLFESEEDGGCVADPRPGTETKTSPGDSDAIILGGDGGPCLAGKSNGKLVGSELGGGDLVVAGEGGEGKSCGGDGLKGIGVEGIESSEEKKDQSEEDEEDDMKPILVGGYV